MTSLQEDQQPAGKKQILWSVKDMAVRIPAGDQSLNADLTVPHNASCLVIFAHGSGSSRKSPRNRYVAEILNEYQCATLLLDLLTEEEEKIDLQTQKLRFDIPLLSDRLLDAAEWAESDPDLRVLPIGLFGASTGAGAALIAAAEEPDHIAAVVSRGGRPDLAGEHLSQVKAPVLLIVGEKDQSVVDLNRKALARLNPLSEIKTVFGAAHLFEEPGALESAAHMAAQWFERHIKKERAAG